MKLLSSFLCLMVMVIMTTANAIPYERRFRDVKLPTQKVIDAQAFTNPAAASAVDVLINNAGNTSAAAASVTSFLAQPDVPRNLVITPGSTTADVAECNVSVSGTNFHNDSISESFVFGVTQSTATTGSKAFKSITSISFPANCENSPFGATWSVGYGEKLGLKRCLDNAGDIIFSLLNGAKEGTAPTMAINASVVESNTADFNGTMNGSNDFVLYFIQNYAQACDP